MSEPGLASVTPLRIAITNPFVWPFVRRGSERLLHDLSTHAHRAGHDVTVIAMAPHETRELREGIRYRLLAERCRTSFRQFNSLHYFAWRLQAVLREERPDVVFCLNYFDAFAALRCRERFGLSFRVVFQSVGIPTRRYFRAVPLDRWFIWTVLRCADQCVVLSQFAQLRLQLEFGRPSQVLPAPVSTQSFRLGEATPADPSRPLVLFVGDVEEPRKGARALCRAFARLRQSIPHLRLRFVGRAGAATIRTLLGLPEVQLVRDGIEFCGVGEVDCLPAHFHSASVTVLPSVWEAFGLVLVESLAAGTPVVGARHGGVTDIIQGDLVGALFDPGPFSQQTNAVEALADALRSVISRGKTAPVAAACRARAEAFSWDTLGPAYLALMLPRAVSSDPQVRC